MLLLGFGVLLTRMDLSSTTWTEALVAIVIVALVRPLSGMIGLLGTRGTRADHLQMAFFGIRGMGTLFYLTYAQNHGDFGDTSALWHIVALTLLISIVVHGSLAQRHVEEHGEEALAT